MSILFSPFYQIVVAKQQRGEKKEKEISVDPKSSVSFSIEARKSSLMYQPAVV